MLTSFLTKFPTTSFYGAKFPNLAAHSFDNKTKINLHARLKLNQLPNTVLVVHFSLECPLRTIEQYCSYYHHFQQYGYRLTFLFLDKTKRELDILRHGRSITVDFLSITHDEIDKFKNLGFSSCSTFLLDREQNIRRYNDLNDADISVEAQHIYQQIYGENPYKFKM